MKRATKLLEDEDQEEAASTEADDDASVESGSHEEAPIPPVPPVPRLNGVDHKA